MPISGGQRCRRGRHSLDIRQESRNIIAQHQRRYFLLNLAPKCLGYLRLHGEIRAAVRPQCANAYAVDILLQTQVCWRFAKCLKCIQKTCIRWAIREMPPCGGVPFQGRRARTKRRSPGHIRTPSTTEAVLLFSGTRPKIPLARLSFPSRPPE